MAIVMAFLSVLINKIKNNSDCTWRASWAAQVSNGSAYPARLPHKETKLY